MFSALMATMHSCFVLGLAVFLHVNPNHLTSSSSSRHKSLPISYFRSVGYCSTTTRIHQLYVNLVTCLVQQKFCFLYPVITSFTPLLCLIISLLHVLTWPYSRYDFFSESFVIAHILLVYNITRKAAKILKVIHPKNNHSNFGDVFFVY